MVWNYLSSQKPTSTKELIDILIANRKVKDQEGFLHPTHPVDMKPEDVGLSQEALERATLRLQEACKKQEPIIIFGDYDCDGVCATTILWETLYEMGCKVMPFIPHRERHGYGLSKKAVDEVLKSGKPSVVVTVDNGIVANEQFQRLRDEGVFTILTDHHQPDKELPPADVIIHTTKLCGTSISWMLSQCLNKEKAQSTLDLCAIATIADQVPLLEANRSFAKFGLEQLNHTERLGLTLLIEAAGLTPGSIDSYSVNYGIAPRINAMGRLESALDALRALCLRKEEKARELIGKLTSVNQTRQDLTHHLITKALERAKEWKDEHIIVIDDPEFHEGVIGLIAGRLCEQFSKPAICIATGENTSKASCRSVSGVHITNLLRKIKDDLLEVGGHPLAAGFTVETIKIPLIKERLCKLAKEEITKEQLISKIDIDCELPAHLATLETAMKLKILEPYGSFNREPLFSFSNASIVEASSVGKEGKHLKVSFMPSDANDGQILYGIAFSKGDTSSKYTKTMQVNIAGTVQINTWKNKSKLDVIVKKIELL